MQGPNAPATNFEIKISFDPSSLPLSQLESLKFKTIQLLDSIQALQRTVEYGFQPAMPPWSEILSKYTVLLSQTHSLMVTLSGAARGAPSNSFSSTAPTSLFEGLVVHPQVTLTETQLDNDMIPLLRNQQTNDVLHAENETVRRLSEKMRTRGSMGILSGVPPDPTLWRESRKPEYEDILQECNQIRSEHDSRVERAIRAVTMLRDRYDWKARVEVETEEPEELDWDPRLGVGETTVETEEDVDMEDGSTDESDLEAGLTETPVATAGEEGLTPTFHR